MRKFTQRKKLKLNQKRSTKLAIPIAGFILILLILGLLIFRTGLFNIKKIEIDKDLDCANTDLLKDVSKLLGKNILFVDSTNSIKNIKEKFICVKAINFSKNFPDKVKLDVLEREPKVKLLILNKVATAAANLENIATPSAKVVQTTYLADEEIIFAKDLNQASDSQIYIQDSDLSLGKNINDLIKKSLDILNQIKTFGLDTQTTQITDKSLVIFPTDSQPKILFSLEKDNNLQIGSLQLIFKKAKIDKESIEFIDLRFDKPILRLAPKKK